MSSVATTRPINTLNSESQDALYCCGVSTITFKGKMPSANLLVLWHESHRFRPQVLCRHMNVPASLPLKVWQRREQTHV